jgi:lactate dehydrogenase-like 2-hydroxyacid dehydrogenase
MRWHSDVSRSSPPRSRDGPSGIAERAFDLASDRVIAAAGLDVFENEPHVHPLLLELENVVLAPHIGSASIDTRRKMSLLAAENALAALQDRRPPNLLNPEVVGR